MLKIGDNVWVNKDYIVGVVLTIPDEGERYLTLTMSSQADTTYADIEGVWVGYVMQEMELK